MYTPKADIYTLLKDIDGVTVYQQYPEVFSSLPAITFFVPNNELTNQLDGEIGYQTIEVTVDLWGLTSVSTSALLETVKSTMQSAGYMLVFASDVPNTESVSHVTTQFKLLY